MVAFRTIRYTSETANGSEVEIKEEHFAKINAWGTGTRRQFVYIKKLNKKDLALIESLGLPRWYFDFTGLGMVFEKDKQEYVSLTQLEALKIKTPWTLKTK